MAAVHGICARAGQLFRPLASDVGIDALIEPCNGESPTGQLIGVQVKSGASFFDKSGRYARLPTDANHLAYWGRCTFPVIGAIHNPATGTTYWLNLTSACSEEAILQGPYNLRIRAFSTTELSPESLCLKVIPEMLSMKRNTLTPSEAGALLRRRAAPGKHGHPKAHHKTLAWQQLIEVIAGISSTDDDVADAAHRLSWYFPTANRRLRRMLEEGLSHATDLQLTKLLRAVHMLLDRGADTAAENVADLFRYVPGHHHRIEGLLSARLLPDDAAEAAIQVLEFTSDDGALRSDLRDTLSLEPIDFDIDKPAKPVRPPK